MSKFDNLRDIREIYLERINDGTARLARAERRQFPRFEVGRLPAKLFTGNEETSVEIANLSLSGAGIMDTPEGLRHGDKVVLATCLGEHGPFVAQCTVVAREVGDARCEFGLKFESIHQEDTNALFFFLYDFWQQREAA